MYATRQQPVQDTATGKEKRENRAPRRIEDIARDKKQCLPPAPAAGNRGTAENQGQEQYKCE